MSYIERLTELCSKKNANYMTGIYIVVGPLNFCLSTYLLDVRHYDTIGFLNVMISCLTALIAFYQFYKAYTTDPGVITEKNQNAYLNKYKRYYDNVIFVPDINCSTCDMIK